jgi:hypothetical protein
MPNPALGIVVPGWIISATGNDNEFQYCVKVVGGASNGLVLSGLATKSSIAKTSVFSFNCPLDATSIRFGILCLTDVAGKELYIDGIQINSDPRLTSYINNSTKLRNKGSNLGNNLKVDSSMAKVNGGCVKPVDGRSRRRE